MEAQALATQAIDSSPPSLKQERITAVVRTAIEAMVWDGLPRAQAAQKAGISEHGLYKALCKSPVKRYYRQQLDVLRESEMARNIHALVSVRDQTANQAARVAAVNALVGQSESTQSAGIHRSAPGVTIIINGNAPVQAIEHQPVTIDNDPA